MSLLLRLIRMSAALAIISYAIAVAAQSSDACGSLQNAYGPFDYRTSKTQLRVVETFHFTPDVAALRSGTTSSLGGDIDYTLRASPNHHGALSAMMNLAFRDHTDKPKGAHYTVQCYFDRALRFTPDDGIVWELYGIFLARTKHVAQASSAFQTAIKNGNDSAYVRYNLGLVYFDVKDYPMALENAQRAYAMGATLPGLRAKLRDVGVWPEVSGKGPKAEGAHEATSNDR